jgi:hypothetical protein
MAKTMKLLTALLLAALLSPAFAQQGHPQQGHRPMPPPERRMSWEDRQQLRDQVRNGQMSRDEARQRWHEERAKGGGEPRRSPEERERLRRDINETNRDLQGGPPRR